jgi:hypothetical protein
MHGIIRTYLWQIRYKTGIEKEESLAAPLFRTSIARRAATQSIVISLTAPTALFWMDSPQSLFVARLILHDRFTSYLRSSLYSVSTCDSSKAIRIAGSA